MACSVFAASARCACACICICICVYLCASVCVCRHVVACCRQHKAAAAPCFLSPQRLALSLSLCQSLCWNFGLVFMFPVGFVFGSNLQDLPCVSLSPPLPLRGYVCVLAKFKVTGINRMLHNPHVRHRNRICLLPRRKNKQKPKKHVAQKCIKQISFHFNPLKTCMPKALYLSCHLLKLANRSRKKIPLDSIYNTADSINCRTLNIKSLS